MQHAGVRRMPRIEEESLESGDLLYLIWGEAENRVACSQAHKEVEVTTSEFRPG